MGDEAAPLGTARPVRPRVGVKALVISDGSVLCVRKRDADGDICSFPGGGQEPGETLVEAVRRELREETGLDVRVGELLFVREYIGKHHEHARTDAQIHVVDHLFLCTLRDPSLPLQALDPDPDQAGVEWLPVDQLAGYRFFPRTLIPHLVEIARGNRPSAPVYVGDVN